MAELTERQLLQKRLGALKAERSSWIPQWQQISDVLMPRSGRFLVTDTNRGEKRHNNIIDNTGTRAHKILSAGLMSGMTSPARPWFRLGVHDPDLADNHAVKAWLSACTRIVLEVFQRSNTYRALHAHYEELGGFGTSASITNLNFKNVIHHNSLTVGEYMIATDHEGIANTIYREFQKPVHEIVSMFGLAACSPQIQTQYARGNLDVWVPLVHCIEPRADRDPSMPDAKNMPFKSCYFEAGSNDPNKCLRDSGYKKFPALVSRWAVSGGDIYGNSPGMEALGDLRALQHEQLRKANAIDYQTRPPLQVPTTAKNSEVETLPGGITYYDASSPAGGIKTLFDVRLDLNALLMDIQDVRQRIRESFFSDLFLMISDTSKDMTATEIAERHEEKLLALGPVLERLHNELLDPLVEDTFAQCLEGGLLPPPPPALHGVELTIEFVSVLAQAQRAVSTTATDRFVGNLGAIAQFKPDVLDKFDADKWADAYSDALGVDPDLIVADEQVALIRNKRAQQQAQAQQAALANANADTAQKLAAAPTGKQNPNALTEIMGMFQGYGSPTAEQY